MLEYSVHTCLPQRQLTNRGDTHGVRRPLQCGVLVRKRHQLVARPNVKEPAGPVVGTAPKGVPIGKEPAQKQGRME
jgi:hypothetical protein